jgi:Tfp pilus assembly protein PilN
MSQLNYNIITKPKQVLGLSLRGMPDNPNVCACLLQQKSGQITPSYTTLGLDGLAAFAAQMPKPCLLSLNLELELCLHRVVQTTPGDNTAPGLTQVFPGLNLDDFYTQTIALPNTQTLVYSMVRKDLVHQLLAQITPHFPFLANVYIGPWAFAPYHHKVLEQEFNIPGTGYTYNRLTQPCILDSNPDSTETYSLAVFGERVQTGYLAPFCAGLACFQQMEFDGAANIPLLSGTREAWTYARRTQTIGFAALGAVLVALLLGFYFFSQYEQAKSALQMELSGYSTQLTKLDSLRQRTQAGAKFNLQQGGQSHAAYLADKLLAALPDGISLDRLNIYPDSDEKSSKFKVGPKLYQRKQIKLSGAALSSSALQALGTSLSRALGAKGSQLQEVKHLSNGSLAFTMLIELP